MERSELSINILILPNLIFHSFPYPTHSGFCVALIPFAHTLHVKTLHPRLAHPPITEAVASGIRLVGGHPFMSYLLCLLFPFCILRKKRGTERNRKWGRESADEEHDWGMVTAEVGTSLGKKGSNWHVIDTSRFWASPSFTRCSSNGPNFHMHNMSGWVNIYAEYKCYCCRAGGGFLTF